MKTRTGCATLLTLLFPVYSAFAVIVGTGTPNANNAAPSDDRGWSSMGQYAQYGAVYLGNGWFITAAHLGKHGTNVAFAGETYAIDTDTWTDIHNEDNTRADFRLLRITSPSAITRPGVPINRKAIAVGTDVTMIGRGYDSQDPVHVPSQTRYYQDTGQAMKWGTNMIRSFDQRFQASGYTTRTFRTIFGSGVAQALDRDSGGGVFVYDSDQETYVLAGLMIAAALGSTGEEATDKYAVHGGPIRSWTQSVDLRHYADQINAVISNP